MNMSWVTFFLTFKDMISSVRWAKGLLRICMNINGYTCNDGHVEKLSKFNHYALFASHWKVICNCLFLDFCTFLLWAFTYKVNKIRNDRFLMEEEWHSYALLEFPLKKYYVQVFVGCVLENCHEIPSKNYILY